MKTTPFLLLSPAVLCLALASPAEAKLAQTIADDNIIVKAPSAVPFTISANSSAGLPVTWEVLTGPVTVSGNTVTLTGATGSVTLRGRQEGDGTYDPAPDKYETFIVENGGGFTKIAAGDAHVAAIRADGTMWTWGRNTNGQLGDGGTTDHAAPQQISGGPSGTTWTSVACGSAHTVALASNGTLWAWGSNSAGQLGIGSSTIAQKNFPTQVQSVSGAVWKGLACGANHTVAWTTQGSLYAWGKNDSGQLGDNTLGNRIAPTKVFGVDNVWAEASCGYAHTLGRRSDRSLWSWGDNAYGQLGDTTIIARKTPVRVGGSADTTTSWVGMSAGLYFNVGRRSDGTLWSWGNNASGQLGDGTTDDKNAPHQVGTDTDWTAASCGASFVVARKSDTWMWSWGGNAVGQLGDLTTEDRLNPVRVLKGPWGSVAAGAASVLAIRNDFLWSWGGNDNSQLALQAGITDQTAVPPGPRLPLASPQAVAALPATVPQTTILPCRVGSFLPPVVTVISGPAVLTADGGSLKFTGPGQVVVDISQAGDAAWSAAALTRFTLNVLPNQPPVTMPDSLGTTQDLAASISLRKLLFNDSDPDGDVISLTAVSPVTAHGSAAISGTKVIYTPAPGFAGTDSFSYTISDPSGATATGTVNVTVASGTGLSSISQNSAIQQTADGWKLHFAGIPGERYIIQYSADLTSWQTLAGPVTADERGVIEYLDNPQPAPPSRFFRTIASPAGAP